MRIKYVRTIGKKQDKQMTAVAENNNKLLKIN